MKLWLITVVRETFISILRITSANNVPTDNTSIFFDFFSGASGIELVIIILSISDLSIRSIAFPLNKPCVA